MKCRQNGELFAERKTCVCGSCFASRFIKQKENSIFFCPSLPLLYVKLRKRRFFVLKKEKRGAFSAIKTLTVAAMLTAISIIIASLCKVIPFLNFGIGLRITLENMPIILAGILFGPIVGGCVGLATDIISCLTAGMVPIPLVTVGAVSIGVISGVFSKYLVKKKGILQITFSVFLAHIIGSMLIKTLGLWQFYYGWGAGGVTLLFRIPIYIGIMAVEIALISLLLKNSAIRKAVGYK